MCVYCSLKRANRQSEVALQLKNAAKEAEVHNQSNKLPKEETLTARQRQRRKQKSKQREKRKREETSQAAEEINEPPEKQRKRITLSDFVDSPSTLLMAD